MASIPDLDAATGEDQVLRDLGRCLKRLNDTANEYKKRKDYYTGAAAEIIAHPDLERLMGRYTEDGHFQLTYAAVPVDALMDRIDLSSLQTKEGAGNDRLKKAWADNELDDDADDFHTKAGYLGDYYALVWPKDPDEPAKGVTIKGKHPLNAVIVYDREDERDPDVGFYRWRVADGWRGVLVYDDALIEVESDKKEPANVEDWQLRRSDDDEDGEFEVIESPWGFAMFHWRPDSKPYGTPVNARAYGPQDAITKLNATDMAGVDYVGFPQRYALLDPAAEADDDIADDFNDEGTTDGPVDPTDPSRLQGNSRLKGAPGSAWLLSGVKEVGQFDAAGDSPFTPREEFQIRSMAVLTRTPLYEFNPDTDNAPSGEARRRADGPINKHAKKVMGTYGRTWAAIGAFILKVTGGGTAESEDVEVEPVWMPSEVATDKEGIELVKAKVLVGVPLRQALKEAGYTDEQVKAWWPGEDKPGDMAISLDMLTALAPALQALGSAKTTGAVSDTDVREMADPYLQGDAPEEPEPPVGVDPALQVPTGEVDPVTGKPVVAPPKGVTPPQLAATQLPAAG